MLFWKNDVHVTIEDSHRYFIDVTLDKNRETEWRFTGFYGEPETHQRMEAWNKLRSLNNRPKFHGFVQGISLKSVDKMKNWGEH